MKTDAQRRKRLQPMFDRWIPRLGLTGWDISYQFVSTISPGDFTNSPAARVYIQNPYQCAHMVFLRKAHDKLKQKERERIVIHELMHCLLQPIAYQLEQTLGTETDLSKTVNASLEPVADHLAAILSHMGDQIGKRKPMYAVYSP